MSLDTLFDIVIQKNISSLEERLALKQHSAHKYSSFGFMPAIGYLTVVYQILQDYKINKKNIIAFGSSYGGYIVSLMGKITPNTFSLIIDNSEFCKAQLEEIYGKGRKALNRYVNDRRYEIPIITDTIWSNDESSEFYFSDAHRQIRSLLIGKS